MINTWDNCKVIHQASNGNEMLQILQNAELPDLLITDLAMPQMDGYELTKLVKNQFPLLKIMVVSMYGSQEMLWRIIQFGANAFVSKNNELSVFKMAIAETMERGYYFCDRMAANFIRNGVDKQQISIWNKFSEEEIKFLKLCCSHITYKAMENEMNCPARHIEYLRERMFLKLNVLSRTNLAIKVKDSGLIF